MELYAIQTAWGHAVINGLGQVKIFTSREDAENYLAGSDLTDVAVYPVSVEVN